MQLEYSEFLVQGIEYWVPGTATADSNCQLLSVFLRASVPLWYITLPPPPPPPLSSPIKRRQQFQQILRRAARLVGCTIDEHQGCQRFR